MAGDSQVTAQLQTLTLALIVFGIALLGFLRWFVVSYWPKQLESRRLAEEKDRKQAQEKADNEIKHQAAIFQEELESRRQERLLEREQRNREAAMHNQILQGFLDSSQNSVKLSERYLDHAEKSLGEIAAHRAVLTDVSDTIDKIHAEFEGMKTKIAEIAQGVQASTTASNTSATALNQVMQSINSFGNKLDSYAQAVKGDSGRIAAMNSPAEAVPQ